jgi:PPOX class probable F420-dependent enzyme
MVDFTSGFGRHANRRLRQEKVIWLTTVDEQNAPQPRPVWFHWDGETILIFSQKGKAKLRHIPHNPKVSLNFNTDEDGGDVVVILGDATILDNPPDESRVKSYLRKYREGIKSLGMTVPEFTESYSLPLIITLQHMRGFVE